MGPTVADVTITPELWARPAHPANVPAEALAMSRLSSVMASIPSNLFQQCVELGLELCRSDSCGISLRERTAAGDDVFRWIAIAGQLAGHLHGTTPRYDSPCGVCVDAGTPVLMRHPDAVYKYLDTGVPLYEVLLVPFGEQGSELEATIWVVAHNPDRKFDGEDARMMWRIAIFAAATLQMAKIVEEAQAEAERQRVRFSELDHRVKNTLQITASLLRSQLSSITDAKAREMINSASTRVLAMGQVHRIGSGADVANLGDIIRSVCGDLLGNRDGPFQFVVSGDVVILPAHRAATVALIVNELITNAIKHGFGECGSGAVGIELRWNAAGEVVLSVTDDGAPLQPHSVGERPMGLGLSLVRRLADQLGGSLEIRAQPKRFVATIAVGG